MKYNNSKDYNIKQREYSTNKVLFTPKDIIDSFNSKPNYTKQDGRLVNFNNGIAIIRNNETNCS